MFSDKEFPCRTHSPFGRMAYPEQTVAPFGWIGQKNWVERAVEPAFLFILNGLAVFAKVA